MLKSALTVAACAAALEVVDAQFLPQISAIARTARSAHMSIASGIVIILTGIVYTLLLAVPRILFLVALRRELAGEIGAGPRQRYALIAAASAGLLLLLTLWSSLSVVAPPPGVELRSGPFNPALFWSQRIAFSFIPSLCWIALLRIFWKRPAPLGLNHTRYLAAVLCAFQSLSGLRSSYTAAVDWDRYAGWTPWTYGLSLAIRTVAWVSMAFFLFALYREPASAPREAESA
jgi:hypothetical protein